jgi:Fe-S oxidoreductase
MPLPTGKVLGILADNLEKRKGVIPLSSSQVAGWAKGLNIPFGGETIIYTGQMYQLIPPINAMTRWMAKFENSSMTKLFGIGRNANKIMNLSWFLALGSGREQRAYDDLLKNVARILKIAGVDFGYLYEKELYSGALLFDEGVDDIFANHAQRVYENLKKNGAKRIITLDPHTTNILRQVYPGIIKNYDLEVKNYLEVLAEKDINISKSLDLDLVIHDPCIYARYENIVEEPRYLLKNAGAVIHEPELSGKLTHCCGGPLESLFPSKAHTIATKRVEQLAECGNKVATMCPICLTNLKRAAVNGLEIRDISEYLIEAYMAENVE